MKPLFGLGERRVVDLVAELYGRGYARLKAGDYAAAVESFDEALAALPGDDRDGPGELLHLKGRALAGLGRHSEALSAQEGAVEAGPRCSEFLAALGDALAAVGLRETAMAAYEEALSKALPGEELVERIELALDALGPNSA